MSLRFRCQALPTQVPSYFFVSEQAEEEVGWGAPDEGFESTEALKVELNADVDEATQEHMANRVELADAREDILPPYLQAMPEDVDEEFEALEAMREIKEDRP